MARVHTDFIALDSFLYDLLLDELSQSVEIPIYRDVPISCQQSLERNLEKRHMVVLKRKYVK